MDTGTSRYPRDDIRVSDADRDAVVSELSEHFQNGRISQDELDERSRQAPQGGTGADRNALFTDLPPRTAAAVTSATGGDLEPDGYDSPPAVRHFPLGRVILALVVLSIVTGNVVTIGHAMF